MTDEAKAPAVKAGDKVVFNNAGKKIAAVVHYLHPSGHADLEYKSEDPTIPGQVIARGIAPANVDAAHGWFVEEAEAAAPAEKDAAAA